MPTSEAEGKTIGQILYETVGRRQNTIAMPASSTSWYLNSPTLHEAWEVVAEEFMQAWDEQRERVIQRAYEEKRNDPKVHGRRIEKIEYRQNNHEHRLEELGKTIIENESKLNMVLDMARQHEAALANHSASIRGVDSAIGAALETLAHVEQKIIALQEGSS